MGVQLTDIQPGSVAQRIGLRRGDHLLAINGHSISDELDLRFHAAEGLLELTIDQPGVGVGRKRVILEDGHPLGVSVAEFRTKACNNKCVFCFVDQLPKGVRRTLRFKDDDFRLSFLHGNYLTLTNLSDGELSRIIEQRLSPLYVSVHATEPAVRAVMLGRSEKHCSLDPMLRLIEGGITVHAQVVLCPGVNDGLHLKRTVSDLSHHYPGVKSVAIVPLGISKYRSNLPSLREINPGYCAQVIEEVHPLQSGFRDSLGVTFSYLADEFYLQADAALPSASSYDGFALLEDGVGMVRHFAGELDACLGKRREDLPGALDGTLVTGRLFYPWLVHFARKVEEKCGGQLRVLRVDNEFLGPKITVAGLLAGRDIAAALKGRDLGCFVIVPGECFSRDADLLLDGMTLQGLQEEIGLPVREASRSVEGFFSALCSVAAESAAKSV